MRARIVEKIAWLGGMLNPQANATGDKSIASKDSRIGIYVIPTDEELMIAHHTAARLASASCSRQPHATSHA
jgi:acetate kinase